MDSLQDKFKELQKHITKAHDILLITHPRPDGDAVGSTAAMIGYLQSLKKNVRAYSPHPVPNKYLFLPWTEHISNNPSEWVDFVPKLIIVLDLSDWERAHIVPYLEQFPREQYAVVVIDHHVALDPMGDLNIIDTTKSSAAELVALFFDHINWTVDRNVANALLMGIITDTENFTNAGTQHSTLRIASALIKRGANYDKLTQHSWRSRNFPELKMFGVALNRLIYHQELRILTTCIRKQDTDEITPGQPPIEGLPNFLKGTKQVRTTLVLKEEDGAVSASLRSISSDIDVARFARLFGGGGHKLSSGFTIPGRLVNEHGTWKVI